jgi:hypothetical protein
MEQFIIEPVISDNLVTFVLPEALVGNYNCIQNGFLRFNNKFEFDLVEKLILTIGKCTIEKTKEELNFLLEMDPKNDIENGIFKLYYWFDKPFYIGNIDDINIGQSFKMELFIKSFDIVPKFVINGFNNENVYEKEYLTNTIFMHINNDQSIEFTDKNVIDMQEFNWRFDNFIDDTEVKFEFVGVLESETEHTFMSRKVDYYTNLTKIAYDIETPEHFYFYRLPIIRYLDEPECQYTSFRLKAYNVDAEMKNYTAAIVCKYRIV